MSARQGIRLALAKFLGNPTRETLRSDAIAGATTAVMLVPQGMAYAMLAGLPPIYGVYAGLAPGVIYALLGTSRQLSVGPVAMDSLLVAAGVGALAQAGTTDYLSAAILLALLVGMIQVAMGLLRLGFLVNLLSVPVVSGFTSAAAMIIGLAQVKHLLGLEVPSSAHVTVIVPAIFDRLGQTNLLTLGLGAVSVALIILAKRYHRRIPGALFAVLVGAALVWGFQLTGRVSVVGAVRAGLPAPRLPEWDWPLVVALLPTALTVALVSFMESISVGTIYAKKAGLRVQPNRELVAVGMSNFVGSFLQGYPVAGGFSRTAVNAEAGAKTPMAGLFTSLLVGLSLYLFTPLFEFVPKASLAAVIVTAVVSLIDYKEAAHLKRVKRADWALLLVTFGATLGLGILQGILVGVGASLIWFVARTTRPHVAVLGRVAGTKMFKNVSRNTGLVTYVGILAVRMDAQFYFGNVAFLRETLDELEAEMDSPLRAVILDCTAMNSLDASGESALGEMLRNYRKRGVQLYLAGVKGPVRDVLEGSGLSQEWGQPARCLSVHEALVACDATEREALHCSEAQPTSAGVRASRASSRL